MQGLGIEFRGWKHSAVNHVRDQDTGHGIGLRTLPHKGGTMFDYDIVYSPDDYGYYAEVIDGLTGATVYVTDIYGDKYGAERSAELWIDENTQNR